MVIKLFIKGDLSEKDALNLAKKFDWKKMKKTVEKLF
jgi:hypothetical protein